MLDQFKDQLVLILLGSAALSLVLALFEDNDTWTAFVDPAVVRISATTVYSSASTLTWLFVDSNYSNTQCGGGCVSGDQCGKGHCGFTRILGK